MKYEIKGTPLPVAICYLEAGETMITELKEILLHPVMQSSIVNFGTIQYANKENVMDVVDNYYIWELEKRGGKL